MERIISHYVKLGNRLALERCEIPPDDTAECPQDGESDAEFHFPRVVVRL